MNQAAIRFGGSDPWYRESDCGRMRIAKLRAQGVDRYEVWERRATGWQQVRVNLISYAEAIQAAGAMDRPEIFAEPITEGA